MVLRHLANLSELRRNCLEFAESVLKSVIFGMNLLQRGIPLSDFYKIWHGEGSPRFAPLHQILAFWHSKCRLTAQKIAKNANLWYTFAPNGYIP